MISFEDIDMARKTFNLGETATIAEIKETLETIQRSGQGGFAVYVDTRLDLNSADNGQLISPEH